MNKQAFIAIKKNGYTFLFKYDKNAPELLHIFVRHLKHPIDAINVFFNQVFTQENLIYDRKESHDNKNWLYWKYKDEVKKVILVISCFEKV